MIGQLRVSLTACVLLATVCMGLVGDVTAQCQRMSVRQEIRQLSNDERTRFINAITTLQSAAQPNAWDRLSRMHWEVQNTVHGYPSFLPWHRLYIDDVEKQLRAVDPTVTMPYWDWSFDSQAPELSPVFQPTWFGGNGQAGTRCVTTGAFARYRPFYPQPHCLQRSWDRGDRISAFWSPEALLALRESHDGSNFDRFRAQLEGAPHGSVHVSIGMDMSIMYSPNDPIFFLHHTFVDKIWADWQASSPRRATSYGGRNPDGSPARTSDVLDRYTLRVSDVMDTRQLCYTYSTFPTATTPRPPRRQRRQEAGVTAGAGTVTQVTTPPADNDRTELLALRIPPPIPEDWLLMNHQNIQEARQAEALMRTVTENINAQEEYVSPAALAVQDAALEKLVRARRESNEANATLFTATNGGNQVVVDVSGAAPRLAKRQAAETETVGPQVRALLTRVLQLSPSYFSPSPAEKSEKLEQIISESI